MKKMFKKATALALVLVMCLMCVPAYASGEMKDESTLRIDATQFQDIYKAVDGSYVYESSEGTYMSVEKVTINTPELADVDYIASAYDLPNEVADGLETAIASVHNEQTQIVLFVPSQTRAGNETATFYTYNGHSMKDYVIYTQNASSGYKTIASGQGTKNVAASVFNLVVSVAGNVIKSVGIFGVGLSALQTVAAMTGTTPTVGYTSDYVQSKVDYDKYNKWTYGKVGNEYILGAVTEKVIINEVTTLHHYVNTYNDDKYTYRYPNTTIESPNYSSPAAKALSNLYNPWTEYQTGSCGGLYIDF